MTRAFVFSVCPRGSCHRCRHRSRRRKAGTSFSTTPTWPRTNRVRTRAGARPSGTCFSTRRRICIFRSEARLKPGAGIGYHEQGEDEVYYVLSGRGVMTLDDTPTDVGPGAAILTRTGSSHGLKQVGSDDLVVIITFEKK